MATDRYEAIHRGFRLTVPESFNAVHDIVGPHADATPDRTAVVAIADDGTEQRISFGELRRNANRAANALAAVGIGHGDPVFVMLPRVPAWHEVLLGCHLLGAIPMPGTTLLTAHDIAYRIGQAQAVAAVTDADGAARVAEAVTSCPTVRTTISIDPDPPDGGWNVWSSLLVEASDRDPDAAPTTAGDPLFIYFTSGTTGFPKMVLHTHASYGAGHEITARFWQDLRPGDLHWTASDTGWAKAAWGALYGQWRMGAAVVLWDQRGKPDFERLLATIGEHRITTFCAPPTIFRQLVLLDLHAFDLTSLRHVVSAGEPLNPEVIEVWREATGLAIHDGYGQTETVNVVANYPWMPIRLGSMGRPTPGFDVDVVDDDGVRLAPGDEGHVAIRVEPDLPVGLFAGYWRNPEATAAAFHGGHYFTGDRAVVDEDGYFWFVARDDDVITSSAYRIGPFEVESALVSHPAVAEAAVVGKPDPMRGEIVKAFVTLVGGWEPTDDLARELQEHCKRETAPYKYPREIEFVPELPKTVSGKIRRVALREQERTKAETTHG